MRKTGKPRLTSLNQRNSHTYMIYTNPTQSIWMILGDLPIQLSDYYYYCRFLSLLVLWWNGFSKKTKKFVCIGYVSLLKVHCVIRPPSPSTTHILIKIFAYCVLAYCALRTTYTNTNRRSDIVRENCGIAYRCQLAARTLSMYNTIGRCRSEKAQ